MSEETDFCMLDHICEMYEKYFRIVDMYRDIQKTLPEMPSNEHIKPNMDKLLELAKSEENALTAEFKKQYESLFAFYKMCMDSTYTLEKAIFDFKMETDEFCNKCKQN